MKVIFIGHRHHQTTLSSRFFVEILSEFAEVTSLFVAPEGEEAKDDDITPIIKEAISTNYDAVVFWQTEHICERIVQYRHKGVFVVPMYDAAIFRPTGYWSKFKLCQFISFSNSLHKTLMEEGCDSYLFRYFPEVTFDTSINIDESVSLSAFFWERRPSEIINLDLVASLCKQLGVGVLHLHNVPDPGAPKRTSLSLDRLSKRYELEIKSSEWFSSRADFDDHVSRSHFFFAPRLYEGIGMSFLEAMARGQIVVAPNKPTMTEYITDHVNGVIYDPSDPQVSLIDISELNQLRGRVMKYASIWRQDWEHDRSRIRSIISRDSDKNIRRDDSNRFQLEIRKRASDRMSRLVSATG